jgi:tetratricopeptide (TPR) repeat protein
LFAVGTSDPSAEFVPDRAGANARIAAALESAGLAPDPDTGQVDARRVPQEVLTVIRPDLAELDRLPKPPRFTALDLATVLDELAVSTLLTLTGDNGNDQGPGDPVVLFVHRWTASELHRHWRAALGPDPVPGWHTAAAQYWRWRVAVWPQDRLAAIHDRLEARHHLIQAANLDEANEVTETVCSQLHQWGAWDTESALITETLALLPGDHHRRPVWYQQLGILAQARGDYDAAQARYEQSLALKERLATRPAWPPATTSSAGWPSSGVTTTRRRPASSRPTAIWATYCLSCCLRNTCPKMPCSATPGPSSSGNVWVSPRSVTTWHR